MTIDKFDALAHFDRLPDSAAVSKLTAAAFLDEATKTIERRVERGELEAVKCGRLLKIRVGSIRKLLKIPSQEALPAPVKRGPGRPRKVKLEEIAGVES